MVPSLIDSVLTFQTEVSQFQSAAHFTHLQIFQQGVQQGSVSVLLIFMVFL